MIVLTNRKDRIREQVSKWASGWANEWMNDWELDGSIDRTFPPPLPQSILSLPPPTVRPHCRLISFDIVITMIRVSIWVGGPTVFLVRWGFEVFPALELVWREIVALAVALAVAVTATPLLLTCWRKRNRSMGRLWAQIRKVRYIDRW